MKKILYLMFAVFMVFALFSCQQTEPKTELPSEDTFDNQTEAENKNGDYIYRLVTEKSHYDKGEPVKIYAELEYVGPKEEVVIKHSSSPFLFPMTETTRNYDIAYAVAAVGNETVLKRGVPLRHETTGGGGYSEQDKEEYKEFMKQVMERKYPKGHYIVDGFADFTVDDNQENYKIKAQIEFSTD